MRTAYFYTLIKVKLVVFLFVSLNAKSTLSQVFVLISLFLVKYLSWFRYSLTFASRTTAD